jgi:hypothetical protein
MNGKTGHSGFGSLRLGWRVAVFCVLLFSTRGASAQLFSMPFSADQVVTKDGKTTTAKVYATPTAMRTEGVQDGKKYITILLYDRKVLWSLMPDEKMYFEMPIPAGAQVAAGMKEMMKGVQVKQESLGSEQVGGYHCDKTRMTVTWQGVTGTTIEWAAKELNGFVVKKQDKTTGELTEYKNIRLGPQDASLFELPAGYKKMSM